MSYMTRGHRIHGTRYEEGWFLECERGDYLAFAEEEAEADQLALLHLEEHRRSKK